MNSARKAKEEAEENLRATRAIAEEVFHLKSVLSFMEKRKITEIILRDAKGEQRSIKARGNYTKVLMMVLYQRLHYLGKRFDEVAPPEA